MRLAPGWSTLTAACLLCGCFGSEDVPPERMPRFERPAAPPQVVLALGSGGPRGFAHIGVLKALEAEGIHPDMVVGASVGAMVGALFAGGMNATELEKAARAINVLEFFEFRMLGGRLATGRAVQVYVNQHLKGRPLEALPIAFAASATRVSDRKLVLFNRGDAGLAVRASSATIEQFDPVRIGDDLYVDGDESSPVPIRAARSLGAKVVIGVDVSAFAEDTPTGVPQEWIDKDARRARQVAAESHEADIVLHPNIGYYAGFSEEYRARVMGAAERYTREQMPAIKAALARAGVQTASTTRRPSGETSR
ncbi:MAG TPA: patatin-like phospholipase family protein [Usitatibacter sp.]|nr:patatin-like phospholipase family protein [Usitatibacter sp.]